MRIVLVLLLLPMVVGHGNHESEGPVLPFGTYLNHIQSWSGILQPGESTERQLAFSGVQLQAGWDVLIHGSSDAPVIVTLIGHDTWEWNGTATKFLTLETAGWPILNVTNHGSDMARFDLYYDQTCDCVGKSVPAISGPLFFNIDAPAGDEVLFEFTYVPVRQYISTPEGDFHGTLNVTVQRVAIVAGGVEVHEGWSTHFNSANWQDCGDMNRFHGCQTVRFTSSGGRQVLLVDSEHTMPGWSLQVHPTFETHAQDDQVQPWPAVLVMVCLIAAAIMRR